jgi:hypothetical protein
MLDKDDGFAFPEEREIVFLTVEEDVPQRGDFEVLRQHFDAGLDSLVEFRELFAIVEEFAKYGVFDLPVRHAISPFLVLIVKRFSWFCK